MKPIFNIDIIYGHEAGVLSTPLLNKWRAHLSNIGEEKISVTKSMLQNGMEIEVVAKITGLSLQELSEIE